MSETPPKVAIEPARRPWTERISVIWVIPMIALVISLGVAWQSWSDRGQLIKIEFESGAGISPRQTELRFRDVKVGIVEDVQFSEDLSGVIVSVRIDKEVAPYADAGAGFWIVRPELTAQGVSGLDTVISGVFIEGTWDSDIGPTRTSFKGQETAPLFRPGSEGLQIALRTIPGGTLTDNSPILFRGIEVGRVGSARISGRGNFAIAEAIIYEDHRDLVTRSTRFSDTSGFSVSIGPTGAEVDFSSLATLVGGGITFDTFVSGGERVADGTVFEVFGDSSAARNSVFNASEVELLELQVIFDDNISGLAVDAPVELSGLRIGSVESLSGIVDNDAFGDSRVRLNVVLGVQPARLGLPGEVSAEAALEFLSGRVDAGLRARLASGSLLTGGLKVELVEVAEPAPATVLRSDDGVIQFPSTKSEISDAAATVEGVFTRINSLPIEELLSNAILFMESATALVSDADLRGTSEEVRLLLSDLRGIVTSQPVQDIPVRLNASLVRIEEMLVQLASEELVPRAIAAIDAAADAAASVGASVEGVPALIDQLNAVAAKAETLPVEDLIVELTGLTSAAEALIDTDAARDLPASLGEALDELNATLAELRQGGAVDNVNATLQSTREAADAVALSSQDLPALVERISQVFEQASATIAGYNKGETLSRDAQAALRDISQAADAITSLARLLERNPSALIRGR